MFLENASCVLQQIDISSCSKADFLDDTAKKKKKKKSLRWFFSCVPLVTLDIILKVYTNLK